MAAPRIIALGDSITYGYPFGNRYSWVEITSQKLGIPITNAGSNGNTLRDMVNRLLTDIIDQKPHYTLFLGGANDVYEGVDLKLMEERYEKIVKTLLQNKIKPILCLPTPIGEKKMEEKLVRLRKFIKKLSKAKKLPLINFYDPFLDARKKNKKIAAGLLEDGVHPSVAGYQLMAEIATPVLQKILK